MEKNVYDIKSYKKKKLKAESNFVTLVMDDDLKYIVKDNCPVLGKLNTSGARKGLPKINSYGKLYRHFLQHGFKIKGLHLKNRHIEEKLDLHGGSKRIEEDYMSKVKLARGMGWMSTVTVIDRRLNFPDQMFIIEGEEDIINLQKAIINQKGKFVLIKRIALEHMESGREIMCILKEVKKGEIEENQELYIAYVQKVDGEMACIDKFNYRQLEFLWGDIFNYRCNKETNRKTREHITCAGQF